MTFRLRSAHSRALIGAVLLAAAMTSASAQASDPKPVEPFTNVLGKSLGDWAGAWFQWAYSIPTARSPLSDMTGQFCDLRQKDGVWFLGGGFPGKPVVVYHRKCTIPKGQYIFFPIFNVLSFAPEFPEDDDPCVHFPREIDQIRCDVNRDIVPKGFEPIPSYLQAGAIELKVEIDGDRVADPFAYRIQSDPGGFHFVVRENSFLSDFGLTAGPRFPAVADGYWIMLPPLAAGDHSVRSFVRLEDERGLDINWKLRVE